MNIGFLITARLKSTRLPQKIMLPLNGYTVIERVIQRAKQVVESDKVVLCTSTDYQDLPLMETAVRNNIYYYNGHPDDVLQRLIDASDLFRFDFIIGITADNPLFSIHHAKVIKEMFKQDQSLDFVYTTGMPIGINIYGINVMALRTVCAVKKQIDTEIWGPLINRPEIFNIREIKAELQYIRPNYRITLDERDDYDLIKFIYSKFEENDIIDILDVYKLLDENNDMAILNSNVVQRDLDQSIKNDIDIYYNKQKDRILSIKNSIYNC